MFDPSLWLSQTSQWLALHRTEILTAIAIGVVLFFILLILRSAAQKLGKRHSDPLSMFAIFARALGNSWLLLLALLSINAVAAMARMPDALSGALQLVLSVVTIAQLAWWARALALGLLERRASQDSEHGSDSLTNALALLRILISAAIFAIALVMVLDKLGVNITGVVAGLGIGGIAIGLAARGVFEDLFAALAIIFDKPFRKGETVQYDTTTARVERIGLKSTRLRAMTGEELSISNTQLLNKQIANLTRLSRRRIHFEIAVNPNTDPALLRQIPELLQQSVTVCDGDEVEVQLIRAGLSAFTIQSINFTADIDVMRDDYDAVFRTRNAIGLALAQHLHEAGIQLAKA